MNCERCQNELEDFLYGELGEDRSAEVRAHLGSCAACAALRNDLEHENELFAQFYEQSSIEPGGETWEAIRARIASEPKPQPQIEPEIGWGERLRRGVFGPRIEWLLTPANLRQMALALLLIGLSVAATAIYLRRGEKETRYLADQNHSADSNPKSSVGPAPSPTPDSSPSTNLASNEKAKPGADPLAAQSGRANNAPQSDSGRKPAPQFAASPLAPRPSAPQLPAPQLSDQELMNRQIARAGREYQKAIKLLDQAIAKRRGSLDPALVKQFESSLALIDKSIEDSRRALRERPDDPTAGQFLLAAYAKKLELMQDVAMQ